MKKSQAYIIKPKYNVQVHTATKTEGTATI